MTGWRKRTIMEMAREVKMPYDFVTGEPINLEKLEAFAELVRADERSRTWTPSEWTEYEHSIAAQEREACAKLLEETADGAKNVDPNGFVWQAIQKSAELIRARGQA